MNKNILFITNLHLWSLDRGKGGRAFINTVEGYKNAGWNIWFVSTGGAVPEHLIDKDKLFENSYPVLDKFILSKNKLLSVFARFSKLFLMNHFFFKTGINILKNHRINKFIIYAYEVESVYSAKKLSKKFNFPLVTRFQGTVHASTPNTLINRIRKSPHFSAMKTSADLTIMTNDGTQGLKTLKRLENKSTEVLFWRNGVNYIPDNILNNRDIYRRQFKFDDKFIFITVSRLENWKKVDRAINAFSIVQKTHPKSNLVILGDGTEKNNLIKLSNKLGLSNEIHFLGAVEQKTVSTYMVAADAFLSFYDLSNLGNPIMEAMMCGKPIITLDVGDTNELVKNGENGILLLMDELGKLPEMMCKVIEDKIFSNLIATGALKTARNEFWSWDERISNEIKKVDSLLGKYFS